MAKDLIHELDAVEKKSLPLVLDIGALQGLKKMPVDVFDNVYLGEVHNDALILCIDVRNFSEYLCSHDEDSVFKLIKEFTANLLSCINQFGYNCSYYKFLGDGVLIIWDEGNDDAVQAALTIFSTYTDFSNEELFKPTDNLSLGGSLVMEKAFKYEISAELSELKYRDYVGYGINLACRLQKLAAANELIVNEVLVKKRGIPYHVGENPTIQKALSRFKGLKEEDRQRVLFYGSKEA